MTVWIHIKWSSLCMLIALALGYLWPVSLNATDQFMNDWQYLRQVLLSSEYRHTEQIVTRWEESPTYWALVRPTHQELVTHTVSEINGALNPTGFQINLVFERPRHFQGFIMIEPEKPFLELQKTAQCDVPGIELRGFACTTYLPDSGKLSKAIVIALEELPPDELKGVLIEEVYQSLGVSNDHDIYRNSINYEDERGPSLMIELGTIDKKTLVFLYKYLEPGDDEMAVKAKFEKYWSSIHVD